MSAPQTLSDLVKSVLIRKTDAFQYVSGTEWHDRFFLFSHGLVKATKHLEHVSESRRVAKWSQKSKATQSVRQALSNVRTLKYAFRIFLVRYFKRFFEQRRDVAPLLNLDLGELRHFNSWRESTPCNCSNFFVGLQEVEDDVGTLSFGLQGLDTRGQGDCPNFDKGRLDFSVALPHDLMEVAQAFLNMKDIVLTGLHVVNRSRMDSYRAPLHVTFPLRDAVKMRYRRYLRLIFFHPDSSYRYMPRELIKMIFAFFEDCPPVFPTCGYSIPFSKEKCTETDLLNIKCSTCHVRRCFEHLSWCADCDESYCDSHLVSCQWCGDDFCPTCAYLQPNLEMDRPCLNCE